MTIMQRALETLMWITAPMLAVAIVVGVVVSLIQTLTSIQDQTFSFAPRAAAMFIVFLVTFPWALRLLITFTSSLFSDFTPYLR
jgi:flagellar biosynthetic protein FliQ